MKTLSTAILALALLQGCGAIESLEKSMTKPTTDTSTSTSVANGSTASKTISGSDISTTTTTSSSTTTSAVIPLAQGTTATTTTSTDGSSLTGTWTTECLDGQVYRKVFANEVMTMTSYIFKDTACTVKGVIQTTSYAYTIDADKIEITSLPGISYTFELEGQNTLIIDNDNNFVYIKSAQ